MNQRKRVLYVVLMLITVVALAFSACTTDDKGNTGGTDNTGNTGNTVNKEISFQLYFLNPSYIETGDETNGMFAKPVEGSVADTFLGDKGAFLETVIAQLKTIPEDGEYATIMGDRYTINHVTVEGDLATVDFSGKNLNGGSLEEVLLLSQILETIVHSDTEITQVRFTVDGQEAETLMGHVDISTPLTSALK